MCKENENFNEAENSALNIADVMPRFLNNEIEEDYDLQDCPNCGSNAVGYDGTGTVPFLECFQCDHNWIP